MRAAVDRVRALPAGELLAVAGLTAIFALSAVWHPADDGGIVLCPFRLATGIPCPGCGLTRSFCAIAKGHVERGLEFHWLGPVVFAVFAVYWVRGVVLLAGGFGVVERFDRTVGRWGLARLLLAALMVVWLVRLAVLGCTGELGALARSGLFLHLL